MKILRNYRYVYIFIIFYFLIPISIIEAFTQYLHKESLGSKSYLFGAAKNQKDFMHHHLSSREYKFKTFYNWEGNPYATKVQFRTDKYGTIFPSTLERSNSDIKESVLFCGGSTIESAFVKEGKRIPDIFSLNSKYNAINASKSGKDLSDCIKTVDYILENNLREIKYIILATNVNTMGRYALKKYLKRNVSPSLFNKKIIYKYFPGIYKSLSILKRKNKFFSEILSKRYRSLKDKYKNYEILDKEYLLGCCSYAAKVNLDGNKGFDWEYEKNKKGYFKFINFQIKELFKIMEKHNLNKEKIIIFIEPNSFHLNEISSKYDYRKKQLLSNKYGVKLTLKKTSEIYELYDSIYENVFLDYGFKVAGKPLVKEKKIFYDSVHFTEYGANLIGVYMSNIFGN